MKRARTLSLSLLIALLLQPLFARDAAAWWNGDWSYRVKITADAGPKGANITEPIGRTQVLVRLHTGNFDFSVVKEDGSDLRFVAGDDRTPLKFHIEKFDGLIDQVGLVWVDIPDLAPGATTTFYVYAGNKTAPSASDSHTTYDADRLLVYHFADDNGLPRDATGYGNNALTAGKRDDGGMIGYGIRLDGSTPIRIPPSASLPIAAGQAMTFSLWARANDATPTGVLYAQRDGANALTIGLDKGIAYAEIETATGKLRSAPGAAVGEGWHHIAIEATDKIVVYVDGQPRGEVAASLPAMNAQATLGTAQPAAAPAAAAPPAPGVPPLATAPPPVPAPGFVGLIDEFEIAKGARPLGALQVAVHGEGPQPSLLGFDIGEQSSPLGSGYFGIIVRSVTPDAWVIIGLLGVMAAISWFVMIRKAVYVSRVAGANRAFRQQFRAAAKQGGFPAIAAATGSILRRSPLYRVYALASRELAERVRGGDLPPDGLLSPQALAVIRAGLDAGLIHETQRLNSLLVLLTIAISGGPFLGLLGTVFGVMITFAAVAAAGDVTINAIAPGIAAALLATVAGLAVAIPALFGYNYFVTRIRDITQQMQVFADELIARMADGVRGPVPAVEDESSMAAE
jgi:biopolymer transport protein ExbB